MMAVRVLGEPCPMCNPSSRGQVPVLPPDFEIDATRLPENVAVERDHKIINLVERAGRKLEPSLVHAGRAMVQRMEAKPYRLLNVMVRRCTLNRDRFRWGVHEEIDGRLVGSALGSYATEREATHAGNAAARAIRRAG
jgi:hypothetical protein